MANLLLESGEYVAQHEHLLAAIKFNLAVHVR